MTEDEKREVIAQLAAETDPARVGAFLHSALLSAWATGYVRGRADEAVDAPNLIAAIAEPVTAH